MKAKQAEIVDLQRKLDAELQQAAFRVSEAIKKMKEESDQKLAEAIQKNEKEIDQRIGAAI